MERKTHTIDVARRPLGRVATEIATLLSGKRKRGYRRNADDGDFVIVRNIKEIKITGNKENDKVYYHHSGYPGGLKETAYSKISERDSMEPLRRAVYGMLPKNKLRNGMIKRLKEEK